jgi:hypothetical protein
LELLAINFDKQEIKKQITLDQVFELLQDWGGDPEYTSYGILSSTICHNQPGEGSRKLYYYNNEEGGLFRCYTGCNDTFDIFELAIKVANIQDNKNYDLNDAVRKLAYRFGLIAYLDDDEEQSGLEDWKILNKYDKIDEIDIKDYNVFLKDYDETILSRFNYNVKIGPWLKEGMTQEVLDESFIGFYPGGDQITIPHFDKEGRFIGLRGRALNQEEAERFGKYRPIKIGKLLYTHPLGMNLYNLNNSQENIAALGKAVVFESEKSCLLYRSYFGPENDISVACCGSSISAYQIHMLIAAGAKEIVVAFDRDFEKLGDDTHKRQIANFRKLHNRYKNYVQLSFINDRNLITGYKNSPIDCGPDKFLQLFKERVIL